MKAFVVALCLLHSLSVSLLAQLSVSVKPPVQSSETEAQTNREPSAARPQPPPLVSPQVHEDRRVTFRVRAPKANEVTVAGEWPGGATPLTKDEQGLWSATLGPLEPDLYGYSFSIDGFQTLDPSNPAVKPMRSPRTSILDVPGDKPALHDFQAVPHGVVRLHEYQSRSLGRLRRLQVYTPSGYEKSRTKYPVLYLLHGAGDNEGTWVALGRAHLIADNLFAWGKATPAIIVMTDGHALPPGPRGTNATERARAIAAFEGDLLQDVIPLIEANYRVREGTAYRAIIGLSMGGGQSLTIGLNHPELFAWVGGMSSSVFSPETTIAHALNDASITNHRLKLLWFACGKDDSLLKRSQEFDELLTARGIRHTFKLTDGNHSWPVWRRYLVEFLPLLFVAETKKG
jgi:enterochelin esterase family protein